MRAKPAEQQRSREKRDLLLKSFEELLMSKPFPQISVMEVALKAGVSVATVYQRFNNENAMAAILMELYFQRVQQWWSRPSRNPDPSDLHGALRRLAEKSWDQMKDLHYVMRPAYLFSRERPDLVDTEWKALEKSAVRGFSNLLENYKDEVNTEDLENSASTLCYLYNHMALGKLLSNDDKQWSVLKNRKAYSVELAKLAHAYLTQPSETNV